MEHFQAMKEKDNAFRQITVIGNRVNSSELLEKKLGLVIVHEGEEYRLRITANGKLILTK